jgi:DNA-binding NtrC family response regulator
MSERRPRTLIADDDAGTRQVLCDCLTHAGYEILLAENGEQAMALAETCHPDLAIVDVVMPEPSGPALVALLKELDPAMQVIVITAYGSIELAVESMRRGAFHFLAKPRG